MTVKIGLKSFYIESFSSTCYTENVKRNGAQFLLTTVIEKSSKNEEKEIKKMINLDKLNFSISKDYAKINKQYYSETKNLDNTLTYNLDKNIIKQVIGINKITDRDSNIIISVSGKVLADKNDLGLINKNNYNEIFNKLNELNLVTINNNIPSKDIQVLACDVTKDIFVEDINKSLFGISKYLDIVSDRYSIKRHKNMSLFIKSYSQSRRDDLCIYRKYDELIKHNNTRYLDIIGYAYVENCKNLLRIERRLASFKEIRNAFEINHDGIIYLNEILESKSNPIGAKFRELKLTEENLK